MFFVIIDIVFQKNKIKYLQRIDEKGSCCKQTFERAFWRPKSICVLEWDNKL